MLDRNLDRSIDKVSYQTRAAVLQERLYNAERARIEARLPVLLVFEGWAGTTIVPTISTLTRRLDPRAVRVHSIAPPTAAEHGFPWLQRFWLRTPAAGELALFERSWYRELVTARLRGDLSAAAWAARCDEVAVFERQLADDGTMIMKFWLQIGHDEQRQRMRRLRRDPLTAWQVTAADRWQLRHHRRVAAVAEDLLTRSSLPHAPWIVIPATSPRYARISVLEMVVEELERRLGRRPAYELPDGEDCYDDIGVSHRATEVPVMPAQPHPALLPALALAAAPPVLARADLSQQLSTHTYTRKLSRLQARLHLLGLEVVRRQRPVVLVFEGWDAAGKGGAIQRLVEILDPRAYIVHAIAAPAGEDRQHHYLYRFWRRLAPRGTMTIFDRSWYGRVLVERVEGFARPDAWQRAYAEINEFERQLVDDGALICKFWMHISPEEQLRRFERRQGIRHKAWKLTDEDWRNRAKWSEYEQAADAMIARTSTAIAPWTIVESEDKLFGRINVLRTLVRRLESELGRVQLKG